MYDEDLGREIDVITGDIVNARLRILSRACERYEKYLPEENILRYEDIVASRGKVLSTIVPAAGDMDEPLENRNLNELYDREGMLRIGGRLLRSECAYWRFYTRESVEILLAAVS